MVESNFGFFFARNAFSCIGLSFRDETIHRELSSLYPRLSELCRDYATLPKLFTVSKVHLISGAAKLSAAENAENRTVQMEQFE